MDDSFAAMAVAVESYRRRKHIIKTNDQLPLVLGLLDEDDAIMSREHVCSSHVSCSSIV